MYTQCYYDHALTDEHCLQLGALATVVQPNKHTQFSATTLQGEIL